MPLTLFTARLGFHRISPDVLNITREGNDLIGVILAPSMSLLWPYLQKRRAGTLTDADWVTYTAGYLAEMRVAYRDHRAQFDAWLRRERIILACMCTHPIRVAGDPDTGCHRRIAAEKIFVPLGAVDGGELDPMAKQAKLF